MATSPPGTNLFRAEPSQAGSGMQGIIGGVVMLALFLAVLGLPPVVYFFLADWHPLARSGIAIVLLATVFGWLGTTALRARGRAAAGVEPSGKGPAGSCSTLPDGVV